MIAYRVREHAADIGYVLSRSLWGRGYMTEAAAAVVEWAINLDFVYRVWAVCDVENKASARVLEKVGKEFCGDTSFIQMCRWSRETVLCIPRSVENSSQPGHAPESQRWNCELVLKPS